MRLDKRARQPETETRARTPSVESYARLEDAGERIRSDPHAVIGHFDRHLGDRRSRRPHDDRHGVRMVKRVLDEVVEYLTQPYGIRIDEW